jgi:hypothetical protein
MYREPPAQSAPGPIVKPLKLAVAEIGEDAPPASFVSALAADHSLIEAIVSIPMPGDRGACYAADGVRAGVSNQLSSRVESARNLSRDLGARYLLVMGGSVDAYTTRNVFAVLDLTIVGAAIVPSVKVNLTGKASAALVDVESGRILMLISSEQKKSGYSPTFYSEEKQNGLEAGLREELQKKLAAEFLAKLKENGPKESEAAAKKDERL